MANEKRLIEYYDAAYQISKLKMDAFRNVDKASCTAYQKALDILMDAPTVDAVEVVHGRWIDDGGLDEDGNGQYRCSHCGVGEKHNPTVTVSYCWNCGAKMDGGNEDV